MSQYDNYTVANGQIGNRVEQYLKGLIEEQKRTITNLEKRLKATEQKVGIYQAGDIFYPGYQNSQVSNTTIINEGDTITNTTGGTNLLHPLIIDPTSCTNTTLGGTKYKVYTIPAEEVNNVFVIAGDFLSEEYSKPFISLPSGGGGADGNWVYIYHSCNEEYVYTLDVGFDPTPLSWEWRFVAGITELYVYSSDLTQWINLNQVTELTGY